MYNCNFCRPTEQGAFSSGSCTAQSYLDECRIKYTNCSKAGESGSSQGLCTSVSYAHQPKANIIMITIALPILIILKQLM
ncbi:hypothetical protein I4U23_006114 [Adineta vaga]|nr:hypothetical protein I4U23_006114 [Adineta vaga]